ncbi:MAG: hypothetical protein ABFD18_11355, partial [Syntrophomonas sp.]
MAQAKQRAILRPPTPYILYHNYIFPEFLINPQKVGIDFAILMSNYLLNKTEEVILLKPDLSVEVCGKRFKNPIV